MDLLRIGSEPLGTRGGTCYAENMHENETPVCKLGP